jgi:molybdate transport system substrate-binding protein
MKNFLAIVLTLIFTLNVYAAQITVYAAADLVYALDEIKNIYEKNYPQDRLRIIYGSSGKGYNQIINGAPFDIIFSADMDYVKKLKEKGFVVSDVKPYAVGRIVLYTLKDSGIDVSKGINVLTEKKVKKIAIANWKHAPYGVAAKECLDKTRLYDKVKDKLVLGENIAQTAQFIETGAADVGFIALSLYKSPRLSSKGYGYLIPQSCHNKILQGMGILIHAKQNKERYETAMRFFNFMQTQKVRGIMNKYGFVLPEEEKK